LKNIQNGLRSVWLAGMALGWLLCANAATADVTGDTNGPEVSAIDDWTGGPPPTDLSGWFFSLDPQQPFPTEPDPSQPWTSPENIATMNYWLSLVTELGDDPSLLTPLYGLGMIGSPNSTTPSQQTSEQGPSDVAEPVTQGLFGEGLALMGLYAAERCRRIRANGYEPR
jgi:hypothetical protein